MELDVKSLARAYTPHIITTLGGWAGAPDAQIDKDIKLRAMLALLDRGWGRPESTTTTKHEGGESPIEFVIRNLNAEKEKKKE